MLPLPRFVRQVEERLVERLLFDQEVVESRKELAQEVVIHLAVPIGVNGPERHGLAIYPFVDNHRVARPPVDPQVRPLEMRCPALSGELQETANVLKIEFVLAGRRLVDDEKLGRTLVDLAPEEEDGHVECVIAMVHHVLHIVAHDVPELLVFEHPGLVVRIEQVGIPPVRHAEVPARPDDEAAHVKGHRHLDARRLFLGLERHGKPVLARFRVHRHANRNPERRGLIVPHVGRLRRVEDVRDQPGQETLFDPFKLAHAGVAGQKPDRNEVHAAHLRLYALRAADGTGGVHPARALVAEAGLEGHLPAPRRGDGHLAGCPWSGGQKDALQRAFQPEEDCRPLAPIRIEGQRPAVGRFRTDREDNEHQNAEAQVDPHPTSPEPFAASRSATVRSSENRHSS